MKIDALTFGRTLLAMAAAVVLVAGTASAAPEEYNPVTGEPNCTYCHTPDKSYSIDYSREDSCSECHGPGLSDAYLEIDERYKIHRDAGHNPDMDAYRKVAEAAGTTRVDAPASGADKGAPADMVLIPAGEFTMGSNDWWPKVQPEHKRTIDAFYLDKYEVTNKRYKKFIDATGRQAPNHWKGGVIPEGREDHPVIYVTWYDAEDFCRWEGKRLPEDYEWEKAARGPEGWTFPWGDKFERDYANTPQYGNDDTLPVGSFEEGKSAYGAYDMAGNAWEWTASWFKPYPGNNHPDENYGERYKVLKGGSWYDCTYYKCGISAPSYNRVFFQPITKNNNFGFRCAKDK